MEQFPMLIHLFRWEAASTRTSRRRMEQCVAVVEDVGGNVVDVPRLTNASPHKYWDGIPSQLSYGDEMHKHIRNAHRLLNEVSSAQISCMVLVVLMILSVTQLSLSLPPYTPCKLCVRMCVSKCAGTLVFWIGALLQLRLRVGGSVRGEKRFTVFPLFSVVLLYASLYKLIFRVFTDNFWGSQI